MSGASSSCGCLARELAATRKSNLRHGGCGSRTYTSWLAAKQRCNYPGNGQFKDYGGRGIRLCERWEKYENFLADMGERPEGKTLDRWPNRDGNYEPGNCRWATPQEQAENTDKLIVWRGKTLKEWSSETGIKVNTLYARYRMTGDLQVDKLTLRKGRKPA